MSCSKRFPCVWGWRSRKVMCVRSPSPALLPLTMGGEPRRTHQSTWQSSRCCCCRCCCCCCCYCCCCSIRNIAPFASSMNFAQRAYKFVEIVSSKKISGHQSHHQRNRVVSLNNSLTLSTFLPPLSLSRPTDKDASV